MTIMGKEYYREYRLKNKDRLNANHRAWVEENKEAHAVYKKEYSKEKSAARHDLMHSDLLRLVNYDRETGRFTRLKTGKLCDTCSTHGYLKVSINGYAYSAHRLAWFYVTKNWPDEEIDHADHDRANNKFSNLSPASRSKNARNTSLRSDNKTGTPGIDKLPGGTWRARITYNKTTHTVGCFETKEQAISARKDAEVNFNFHANHGRG